MMFCVALLSAEMIRCDQYHSCWEGVCVFHLRVCLSLQFLCKVQADRSCSKEEIAGEGSGKSNFCYIAMIKGLTEGRQKGCRQR